MIQKLPPKTSYGCELHHGEEARKAMVDRANYIQKVVGRTMGPNGSPVLLDRADRAPSLTKDGVSVLYDLEKYDLATAEDDHIYNIVYEIVRAASEDVSKNTGDGTSTICWLTAEFMRELSKCYNAGLNPRKVLSGFNEAYKVFMADLYDLAVAAETEDTIAAALHTAANGNKEIIETLTDVFLDVGDEGMIFIRDPQAVHTRVYYEEGTDLPIKLDTPEILDPETLKLEMTNPYVCVIQDRITSAWDIVNILEDVANRGETQDIIFAYSEMDEGAKMLIHKNNNSKDVDFRIASFRMPLYTDRQRDYLRDFSAIVDATLIHKQADLDIKNCGLEELGRAEKVVLRSTLVSVINGRGTQVEVEPGLTRLQQRINEVTDERNAFTGNIEERNRYNERLAKMTGAVVSICPGAHSQTEIVEKKGAYEDAIRAGQCALEGGIVPGGGWSWYSIAERLEQQLPEVSNDYEFIAGAKAALNSLKSVFEKLALDAGTNAFALSKKIKDYHSEHPDTPLDYITVDLHTMKVGNFVDVRVVDPIILHDDVITQAVSIAKTLMNSGCVITIEPTEEYKEYKRVQKFEHLRV